MADCCDTVSCLWPTAETQSLLFVSYLYVARGPCGASFKTVTVEPYLNNVKVTRGARPPRPARSPEVIDASRWPALGVCQNNYCIH